jgi:hypothetical protein
MTTTSSRKMDETMINCTCLEVVVPHPIKEIGKVMMYVFKMKDDFVFSIPHHNWSYYKAGKGEVEVTGPSSFRYPAYNKILINEMSRAMEAV